MFSKLWGEGNKFTEESLGGVNEKEERDLLLLSSTSYTPDEDFDMVVEALKEFNDRMVKEHGKLGFGVGS